MSATDAIPAAAEQLFDRAYALADEQSLGDFPREAFAVTALGDAYARAVASCIGSAADRERYAQGLEHALGSICTGVQIQLSALKHKEGLN